MPTFAERLCEALEKRDIKAVELSRKTGTPESVISQYKKGMYEPKQKRTELFAKALNVSVDWLMGADVPMNRNINIPLSLSDHEQAVISAYRAQPEMQPAVDRLLNVPPEDMSEQLAADMANTIKAAEKLGAPCPKKK